MKHAKLRKYIAVLLLIGMVLPFCACDLSSPRMTFLKALKRTFGQTPLLPDISLLSETVTQMCASDQKAIGLDATVLRLSLPQVSSFDASLAEGIGINSQFVFAPAKRIGVSDLSLSYGSVNVLSGKLALNNSKLSACLPQVHPAAFSIDLNTLGKDANNKGLVSKAIADYISLPKDFQINIWSFLDQWQTNTLQNRTVPPSLKESVLALEKKAAYLYGTVGKAVDPVESTAKKTVVLRFSETDFNDFLQNTEQALTSLSLPFETDKNLRLLVKKVKERVCGDVSLVCGISDNKMISFMKLLFTTEDSEWCFFVKVDYRSLSRILFDIAIRCNDTPLYSGTVKLDSDSKYYAVDARVLVGSDSPQKTLLFSGELDKRASEFIVDVSYGSDAVPCVSLNTSGTYRYDKENHSLLFDFDYLDFTGQQIPDFSVTGAVSLFPTAQMPDYTYSKEYRVFSINALDLLILGPAVKKNLDSNPIIHEVLESIL